MASKKISDNPAKGVKWDLSDLYIGIKDPQIEKDKNKAAKLVKNFTEKYQGKINEKSVTPEILLSAIKDYEKMMETLYKLGIYASLEFLVDSHTQAIKAFNQDIEEFQTQLSSQLVWFDLEIKQIPDKVFSKLIRSEKLSGYKYFLETERKFKPYTLSEKEEIILVKKSQTSSSAFVRFFDEKTAYLRFPLEVKGKKKDLTISELSEYLSHHHDRQVRKDASKVFTDVFKENHHFYTFVLNTLLLDKKISDEMRDYEFPQQATFMSYDVTKDMVESMTHAVTSSVDIVHRYYRAKKKIQKLSKLYEWDRYSPLFNEQTKKYSWKESRNLISNSFEKVNPLIKNIADKFYDNNWIHAELGPHKQSGAFCMPGTPQINPFILCNYTGNLNDITTVAHELGHGIHMFLSQKNNSLINSTPSTATAEIASIFAESLTFDSLLYEINNTKLKMNLLARKIEGSIATVFRQTEFYLFETDIHTHRREKGELSTEDINNYYQTRLQHMFGSSLTLTEGHKYWWSYIGHFYHFNFYVFTYAFGELLSLALYEKYKQEGEDFMKNYIEALKAGGSKSPAEITSMMGVDISDPEFWNKGLDLLDAYVTEFEQLAANV